MSKDTAFDYVCDHRDALAEENKALTQKNDQLLAALKDIRDNARRLGSVFCECVAENAIAKESAHP